MKPLPFSPFPEFLVIYLLSLMKMCGHLPLIFDPDSTHTCPSRGGWNIWQVATDWSHSYVATLITKRAFCIWQQDDGCTGMKHAEVVSIKLWCTASMLIQDTKPCKVAKEAVSDLLFLYFHLLTP